MVVNCPTVFNCVAKFCLDTGPKYLLFHDIFLGVSKKLFYFNLRMLHGASFPIIDFREQGKHDGTLVGHRLQFEFRIAQDGRISNCRKNSIVSSIVGILWV